MNENTNITENQNTDDGSDPSLEKSTMLDNLDGGNVDDRGVTPAMVDKQFRQEPTSRHFKKLIDDDLKGQGGSKLDEMDPDRVT